MKLSIRLFPLLLLAAALTFAGCKKSEPAPVAPEKKPAAAAPAADKPAVEAAKPQAKPAEAEQALAAPEKKPVAAKPVAPAAPADTPAAKPAAPAKEGAAAPAEPEGDQVKTPWADLKPGASVKMKSFNGAMTTMEVVKIEGDTATIRLTAEMPGKAEPMVQEMLMPRFMPAAEMEKADNAKGTKVGEEKLQVGGKDVLCEVWESKNTVPMTEAQDGEPATTKTITMRTYTNKDVPGQTVRIDSDMLGKMQIVMEVVEFTN